MPDEPATRPDPIATPPAAAAPDAFSPDERKALLDDLAGIRAELKRLTDLVGSIIDPPVTLNHFRKGAALRIDDSQSQINNPTF